MLSAPVLFSLLSLSLPLVSAAHGSTRRAHAGKQRQVSEGEDVSKRGPATGFNGARFTYYDTSVGLGSCGNLNQNSAYTVALNEAQFASFGGGWPAPVCGKQITISYGGKQIQATVQDTCPYGSCPYGAVDLSMGLFSAFADHSVGVFYADWWFTDSGTQNPAPAPAPAPADPTTTSVYVAPTTSTTPAYVAPTTTSTSEYVAPTVHAAVIPTTSTSEAASTSTAAASPEPVVESTSSPAPAPAPVAAPTTTYSPPAAAAASSAAPASTGEWNDYSGLSAEEYDALPYCDELDETEQGPSSYDIYSSYNASLVCSKPSSLVLLNGTSVLYTGTLPAFINSTLSTFGLSFNASLVASYAGFNASIFALANGTTGWNTSLFGGGNSTTLSRANETTLLMATTAYCYDSTFHPLSTSNFTFPNLTALASTFNISSLAALNPSAATAGFNASAFTPSALFSLFGRK